jgi:DNA primase
MIPDHVVDEVRARADIVDIVGEVVELKKSGREFKGRCPFHEDRTPSFYVVPSKGFYNCFGCGESGDAFTFVMKRLGLDFVEAVKHVGGRVGVDVREVARGEQDDDPNRALWEANAFARDYYRGRLTDPDVGAGARAYLEERGIDEATAERFDLGFAPDGWRNLRDAAAKHGIDDQILFAAGLLTGDEGKEPYDRFRDRIIFPIEGTGRRVVAFGGRALPSVPGAGAKPGRHAPPKYLNSPETAIYHKGSVLYGLARGKHAIRKEGAALVVEGYMDAVSLAAGGFEHVVATLGTAMTEEQARLVGRYAKRVVLLFDSDLAGLKATFRAGDTLLAAGVHPSVATFPEGEDPDSVVRKEGKDGMEAYLAQALDVLERKLRILEERDSFGSIEGTRDAVDRLLPTIRATLDPTLRDIYVSKVADRTGVRRETLEAELEGGPRGGIGRDGRAAGTRPQREEAGRARRPDAPRSPRQNRPGPTSYSRIPGMGPERKLLLLLVKDRGWIDRAAERIGPTDFVEPAYRAIFEALLEDPDLVRAPDGMDEAAARRLEELMASTEELVHAERVFLESVGRIEGLAFDRKWRDVNQRLDEARSEEEKLGLLEEKARLGRERRAIGLDWSSVARKSHPTEHRER